MVCTEVHRCALSVPLEVLCAVRFCTALVLKPEFVPTSGESTKDWHQEDSFNESLEKVFVQPSHVALPEHSLCV